MSAATDYGALLDALRGVSWPARIASRGAAAGTHKSRLRGSSAEFTEYRAYRQGDDPRRLDWKLLARTDRAYLRITNERATLPTLFVVDASASMAFPEANLAKWSLASALTVGLAGVAHAAGDPVALAIPGTPPRRLPFRTRSGVVNEVAHALDATAPAGDAPLAPLLRDTGRAARVAILSDLLGDAPALLRTARELLGRGVELVLLHLIAREELEPAAAARLAEDPEQPSLRRPLTSATLPQYRERFTAWRTSTAREWRAAGARYIEVVTDERVEHAVRRVVAA